MNATTVATTGVYHMRNAAKHPFSRVTRHPISIWYLRRISSVHHSSRETTRYAKKTKTAAAAIQSDAASERR